MTEQWPMFGCDPGHSGHGEDLTRPKWPIELLWEHDFEGRRAWSAPTVDRRGQAYVHLKRTQVYSPNFRAIGSDGRLRWALNTGPGYGPGAPAPATGDEFAVLPDAPDAWIVERRGGGRVTEITLHPSGAVHAAPTIADGQIHVGFTSYDLETGEKRWEYEYDGPVYGIEKQTGEFVERSRGPVGSRAAVINGIVYVAGYVREGRTRYVEEEDLEDARDSTEESSLVASPDPDGEFRDDYEEWGHVHALDSETGQLVWVNEFDTPVDWSTPTVVADRSVFVFDEEQRLRAFDAEDGSEKWRADVGTSIAGSRPAIANGLTFIAENEGKLVAVDVESGSEQWRLNVGDELAGPPAIADDHVHISTKQGRVFGFSTNGEQSWELDIDARIWTGPVVVNGRIYVAGEALYCLGTRD